MTNMFYIYELVDPITNEPRYIGHTINTYNRLHSHLTKSKKGKSYKDIWIRKLLKQGITPILNIIDEVESDVYFWEKFYIWLYKSWGMRLTNTALIIIGGGDTFTADFKKEARRLRMHEIMKSRYSDPVERVKLSQKCKKTWTDPALIEKAITYGKKSAELHRETKRERMRKKWHDNPEWADKLITLCNIARSVQIEQIDEFGNVIKSFKSVTSAAKELKIAQSSISLVINGKRKSARGFYFKKQTV